MLQVVGFLVFFPGDATHSQGDVCVGLELAAECQAAAPGSAETFRGKALAGGFEVVEDVVVSHG